MGLAITVQAVVVQEPTGLLDYVFAGAAIVLYMFTIVSGILFVEDPRRITPLRVAWFLQMPWVSSPVLVYGFCSGCRIIAGLGLTDGRLSASFHFGSDFQFFILGSHPWFVGINIFAVLVLVSLAMYTRTPNAALVPTATAHSVSD